MKVRMNARRLAYVAAAAALLIAGCIVSGQFVIVFDVPGDLTSSDTNIHSKLVDLTDNSTWEDHKDNIKNIVDVKFKMTIRNNTSTAASGEIWASDGDHEYTTLADLKAAGHGTRILSGITVPASGTKTVGYVESADYIENLSTFLDMVQSGKFYIYGIAAAAPFDITVESGTSLLITFSAGM